MIKTLLLMLLLVNIATGQNVYDKIFVDENVILIGRIKSETDSQIRFVDQEKKEEITLFKRNLLKVIHSNGKIDLYKSTQVSVQPEKAKEDDYEYGFLKLQINNRKESYNTEMPSQYDIYDQRHYILDINGATWKTFITLDKATYWTDPNTIYVKLKPGRYNAEFWVWLSKASILYGYDYDKVKSAAFAQKATNKFGFTIQKKYTTPVTIEYLFTSSNYLLVTSWEVKPTIIEGSIYFDEDLYRQFTSDSGKKYDYWNAYEYPY